MTRKNWIFFWNMTQKNWIFFFFEIWLKKNWIFSDYDSKDLNFLIPFDSKNWTLFISLKDFLWLRRQELTVLFFWKWLKRCELFWTFFFFLNMTQRIEPSFQKWRKKIELSLRNMSQRIEYDSKNWFFFEKNHSNYRTFLWLKELSPV